MVLKLRRIKPSLLMPRKEREKEGSFTNISTRLGDQVLLQIRGKRRRTYHTYNGIRCKKYGDYASKCFSSNKRKHESSTTDVEDGHHLNKLRNEERT